MSVPVAATCRIAALALALGALTSCATLTKDECTSVNWDELGRSDGSQGHPYSRIEQHRSACAEHKLPVDEQRWTQGWEQGIRVYCTPENGLLQGREGRSYANSCPPELKADFENAYFVAKGVYDARLSRDRLAVELETLRRELRDAKKPEDRRRIESSIDSKRSEIRRAEDRLRDAERDYDRYVFSRR